MNRIAQRRIKDDIKKHPRNSLYKKQINVLINKDVLNQGKRYLVILNFLADQEKSLIDIFLHFFDSIYQIKASPTTSKIQRSINYNKTFKFLVKLYFLLDKFLPRVVKPTQQEIVSEMDIVGKNKSFYLDGESTKANLQNFINQQKMQINNKFEQLLIQAKKTQKQSQQIIKYGIILKMCQQQKQKTIQQIMKIEDQAIKSIYIPLQMQDMPRIYLQRFLDILISIRFTKKLYRLTNFSNFIENIYKNYYKTQSQGIANIRDNSVAPKKFILKRYTNNDNEALMNIFDLVQIRAKNIKYEQQSYQISKQLLKQLISHKNITKTYYPYLSPTSILFNQISLNVQLSYQNPLLNSLGLLQRPTNMENMICFQATPKFYDSFASINELINPDLLTNYLIDVIKYFKESQEGDNQHPLLKNKQKQGNKSQAWRFMMAVYYIMNGQQYYRGKQSKRIQTLYQFKKFVQQQDSKLNNPSQIYYLQLLGANFTNLLPKNNHKSEFYHNIYFFQDLFDRSENSNDQIRQYGSVKSQQYLKNFNKIIREILLLIENQTISKVYNTVIYLLRFYIGIFRQFYQIYYLCGFCIKRVELGYKFLEDYMNKAQNQLANLSKHHFETAFSKLRQYKKRYETRRQSQITYILQKYKQEFLGISTYYDLMVSIKSQLSLILLQASQAFSNLIYQIKDDQIKQKILILKRRLGQSLYILKRRIKYIINNEFLINQHRRNINQETKYNKNKLKLYTTAAFQMNFDNFIIIESIVLPILNTGQFSNKNSRNNQKGIQDYRQLNDLCEYSLQILLDGSQQTDQINQFYSEQNWKLQAVKQHRY